MVVVPDDIDCVDVVITVESLLLIDVCLDICFVCDGKTFCCFDIELLLIIGVDGNVFCDTMVEYGRTGCVVDGG
jgi:hypothetical protein